MDAKEQNRELSVTSGLAGLSPETLATLAVITFVAAGIRGLTGFGMAIILVPLLGAVIRPDEAVVLAILLQFVIGPIGLKTIIAESDRPSSLIVAASAVATTPLGLWLLQSTTPDLARLLIAGVAIVAFLLVLLPAKGERRPGLPVTLATGFGAGVLTGFAGMPGPPVVPFYLRQGLPPRVARASMMLIFFATAIAGTGVAFLFGLVTATLVQVTLLLLIPMLAGNWLGSRAFGKIDARLWRSAVALLLGAAAVSAVWHVVY